MRFQGENCTLSFALSFEGKNVLLNATLWPRRIAPQQQRQPEPWLRFRSLFSEKDLLQLQQWLASNSTDPLQFTDPIRQVRRLPNAEDGTVQLELDYYLSPEPAWWEWEVSFPLKIRLEVRPAEFNYLINALNRDNWSRDMTW